MKQIFRQEFMKIIVKRGLFILIVFVCILKAIVVLSAYNDQMYDDSRLHKRYMEYMQQLSGELTAEKQALILSDIKEYELAVEVIERASELLAANYISTEEFLVVVMENSEITYYQAVITQIQLQYEYVSGDSDQRYFLDPSGMGYLVNKASVDGLLLFLVIVVSSLIFTYEYITEMETINATTVGGKRNLMRAKITLLLIVIAGFSLGFSLFEFFVVYYRYGAQWLSYPIQSLPYFVSSDLAISFGQLLVFMALLCTLGYVYLGYAIAWVSQKLKSVAFSMFFGVAITLLPLLMVSAFPYLLYYFPHPAALMIPTGYFRGDSLWYEAVAFRRVPGFFVGVAIVFAAIVIVVLVRGIVPKVVVKHWGLKHEK